MKLSGQLSEALLSSQLYISQQIYISFSKHTNLVVIKLIITKSLPFPITTRDNDIKSDHLLPHTSFKINLINSNSSLPFNIPWLYKIQYVNIWMLIFFILKLKYKWNEDMSFKTCLIYRFKFYEIVKNLWLNLLVYHYKTRFYKGKNT